MKRTFIETPIFTKRWYELGLTDEDLRYLQNRILNSTTIIGDVIPETYGLRKIRVAASGHGKRGGARVIFVDVDIKETVYFLNVYSKNEKSDLTVSEKKALRFAAKILREE